MLLLTAVTAILAVASPAPDAQVEKKLPVVTEEQAAEALCNDVECNEIVLNDLVVEDEAANEQ